MTDARWQQVKALFQATVDRPPAERAAFLAAATGSDEALRREIESLLASDTSIGFTDRLPFDGVENRPLRQGRGPQRHGRCERDYWDRGPL